MTSPNVSQRKPHALDANDPAVEIECENERANVAGIDGGDNRLGTPDTVKPRQCQKGKLKWGVILLSALAALTALAASLSFTSLVTHVLSRDDWIGWFGFGLALIAGLALVVIVVRELFGLLRLLRLTRLRKAITSVMRDKNLEHERAVVKRLQAHYSTRSELKWPLERLKDHQSDVRDAGELLRLADREVMAPLDIKARELILKSAKRVTVATAISPMVWMAMLYVVAENLRLIKNLATLYGARPGGVGAMKLARMVFTHILATGGLALTDDLLGQFLGQDLVRRLSRRLGEGVFNGALTARIGTAAVAVTRPLPFLDAEPLRLRDIMRDLARNTVKVKS